MAIIKGSYYDEDEAEPTAPESSEGGATAVIPASLLQGKTFEVGDRVVLQIQSVEGDNLVVSYAEEGGEEETEAPVEAPEEMPEGMPAETAEDPMYS